MDKETYNRIRAAVATLVGITMAVSVIRNTWALALGGVLLGMVVLITAKKKVDDVLYDERTKIVREKAASATLGLVTVLLAVVGIGLIETSFWGYAANRELGYMMAFLANIILGVNAFFNWYYNNQLGG
jgi:uncharacterized membrane protein